MKNLKPIFWKYFLSVYFTLSSFGLSAQEIFRDGKLLRGELWQKYEISDKADFYVATNGNDAWSGTLHSPNGDKTDGPFATLKRAQQAVRTLKSEVYFPKDEPVETRWIGSPHPLGRGKDIVVLIREGYFELNEPLLFSPEDGGERVETNLPTGAFEYHALRDHYVTYAAYPGEKPVIAGGRRITGWKQKRNIWTASPARERVEMLVVNGLKMTLARTPNEGYFVPPVISETTDVLHFNAGELKAWENMQNNRVHMLLRWHQGNNSFTTIDAKKGVATLASPQEGVVIVPPRYYVENVKQLMDAPGEWYFDAKSKLLSLIALEGAGDMNNATVCTPELQELLIVRGERGKPVRNLRIYGLTFEGALAGKSAISYSYAHSNEFVDNEVRAAVGTGISLLEGCYQTRILNNTIHGIDNMAILVRGPEDPQSGKDILRETQISFNHISNCGGVNIDASFCLFTTISHNYITKTRGRYAISVGGWHNLEEAIDGAYTVEYNHLDDVQKDADDSGAIKTAGTTFNSVVQKNLIHDVRAGFFNDNVGFWFDNMSLGWVARDNIFYNLEQGEMKLCAANLADNLYENNYVIETPVHAPETFITGEPDITYADLVVSSAELETQNYISSGSNIHINATIYNAGSTGIARVPLYIDGKVSEIKDIPVIHNNSVMAAFDVRMYGEGVHRFAIGSTAYQEVMVRGEKPAVVFDELIFSDARILHGEKARITAMAKNLINTSQLIDAVLYLDNNVSEQVSIHLQPGESRLVHFNISPAVGAYRVRVGNSGESELKVLDYTTVNIAQSDLSEYCSAKAKPYEINADKTQNRFRIKAGGSDFFHAEDSYAAVYLKQVKGDFVATVKINRFGERTHEWFRAGLFARNDIAQSFDTQPGSKGSFLMFGTPGRAGINYDEFANGCMHKASSQNLPEDLTYPYWLKLERHGNYFVGSISLDGENWINEKRSADIPGLEEIIGLGLAAGSCDQVPYWVEFEDWIVKVAK
jgi:regulation of enolase protein 1 (concanavalin A-like superfamily)